uniref:hypothetical protein n=1 Tax=Serratia marcescens TaxID=615 RepID=UPI001CA37F5D
MFFSKKKFVVSKLAVACTIAMASQANAVVSNDISGTTYNTFVHYNDESYADGVYYKGYVGWNNYESNDGFQNGNIYPEIK